MAQTADKKTDAWMPLWIGAYLADTMHLTTLQHGAYFLLLIAYWREREPLADNDDELRSITKLERAEWKRNRAVLAKFFTVADGVWWHKRVEAEIAAADKRSKASTAKAEKAAGARWNKCSDDASSNAPSIPQAVLEDVLEVCPTPSPIPNPPGSSEAKASGVEPPAGEDEAETEKAEMWRAARSLLNSQGMPKAQIGSFIGKLAQDYGQDVVLKVIRGSVSAQPADAVSYIKAACQAEKGERTAKAAPATVQSDAAAKTAAEAAKYAAHCSTPEAKAAADAARLAVMSRHLKPKTEEQPA